MWFSQKKQKVTQHNTTQVLANILSNGIDVSINELIQYQTKTSLINLAARKDLHGKMSGNYLARSKGRGMEFDEVRHYQTGDDIRAIDWRVTARTGITHTKVFREEVERPVFIATDLNDNMLFGSQLLFKSVQASHLAALVAWHAKERGDRIGGIVFNQYKHTELKPRSRQQGVLHYLYSLSNIHQNTSEALFNTHSESDTSKGSAQKSFDENCGRIRQLSKPGSLVYLITDGNHLSQESLRHLTNISRHCELVVCLISDPLEIELPKSDKKINVAVTDGKKKQQLLIGDKNLAKKYKQQAEELTQNKEALLAKAGARILHFSAGTTLETQLKNGITSWTR
ncbi:DUF58 domain-containing protein [Pseudocolwellia agarivorans]|uniref:DUF58 domain-containing protein n=1 Tax=Pseudocolwellia agarivorans TaxID=1911682 RepID=UPI0009872DEE|nr:DUF58 domain-containing protein [Pseudocolwellia agarivorans]